MKVFLILLPILLHSLSSPVPSPLSLFPSLPGLLGPLGSVLQEGMEAGAMAAEAGGAMMPMDAAAMMPMMNMMNMMPMMTSFILPGVGLGLLKGIILAELLKEKPRKSYGHYTPSHYGYQRTFHKKEH